MQKKIPLLEILTPIQIIVCGIILTVLASTSLGFFILLYLYLR